MKRFILKSLLAVALVLVALPVICIVRLAIHLQTKQYLFEVKPHQKVLAIGDSHIECSFIEDEEYGIKVFAKAGSPYSTTLMRLKELERKGSLDEIKYLIVSIGYPIFDLALNINERFMNSFWDFFPYSLRYPSLSPISSDALTPFIFNRIFSSSSPAIATDVKTMKEYKNLSDFNETEVHELLTAQYDWLLTDNFPDDDYLLDKKQYALWILREMKKIADAKGIKFILISSPKYAHRAKVFTPQAHERFDKMYAIISEVIDELTNEGFVHYDCTHVFDDVDDIGLFRDATHLSLRGAKVFTGKFHKEILQNLMKESPQNQ